LERIDLSLECTYLPACKIIWHDKRIQDKMDVAKRRCMEIDGCFPLVTRLGITYVPPIVLVYLLLKYDMFGRRCPTTKTGFLLLMTSFTCFFVVLVITVLTYFLRTKPIHASLCGSIGKGFVYHACGREFESRLKWNFSNFPHHL